MNRLTAFALAVFASAVVTTAPSLAATRAAGPQGGAPVAAGSLTSLVIRQVPGSYHIAVSGKAPASTQIVLTLLGTISSDLPDVMVSRHQVITDATGNFKLEIPAAGDYFRDGLMTVVAASPSGTILAKSQIVLKAPNADVTVPNETHLDTET